MKDSKVKNIIYILLKIRPVKAKQNKNKKVNRLNGYWIVIIPDQ